MKFVYTCYENFHAPRGKESTFDFLSSLEEVLLFLHKLNYKIKRRPFLLDLAVGLSDVRSYWYPRVPKMVPKYHNIVPWDPKNSMA